MKPQVNIEELKAKLGPIKIIEAGKLKAYFRKPDLKIWKFCVKAIEKSQTDFKKAMCINCFVDGDRELLETPYLEDLSEIINEFIEYADADVQRDGAAFLVKVLDKQARFRPITIEMQSQAERQNPGDAPFLTQQNLLSMMWLDGDEELRNPDNLDYYMPVLRTLKDLREKHILSVKNA